MSNQQQVDLGLSQREREVLRLFGQGFGASEIANQSGRSEKTIATQLTAAQVKLQLRSRGELRRFAIKAVAEGVLPDQPGALEPSQ